MSGELEGWEYTKYIFIVRTSTYIVAHSVEWLISVISPLRCSSIKRGVIIQSMYEHSNTFLLSFSPQSPISFFPESYVHNTSGDDTLHTIMRASYHLRAFPIHQTINFNIYTSFLIVKKKIIVDQ